LKCAGDRAPTVHSRWGKLALEATVAPLSDIAPDVSNRSRSREAAPMRRFPNGASQPSIGGRAAHRERAGTSGGSCYGPVT